MIRSISRAPGKMGSGPLGRKVNGRRYWGGSIVVLGSIMSGSCIPGELGLGGLGVELKWRSRSMNPDFTGMMMPLDS